MHEIGHRTFHNFRPCLLVRCQNFVVGIVLKWRCLQATVCVRDLRMNGLSGIQDSGSQDWSGLGDGWGRDPVTVSGQFLWQQCQSLWRRRCHIAEPEQVKLHHVLRTLLRVCWCLVSAPWGPGMFLRSESESEREQGLGVRTRPFRISRTKRTLLDDGCEGQPLPCTVDQELDGRAGYSLSSAGISRIRREPPMTQDQTC